MKKIFASLLMFAVLAAGVVGCSSTPSSKKKEDGTKLPIKTPDSTHMTPKELTFKSPADTTITEGKDATVEISVVRDKDKGDAVKLKVTDLPAGVTVVEADPTIAKDMASTKLTLKAAADAKEVTDAKVMVSGESGALKGSTTFKLTVKKAATAPPIPPKTDKPKTDKPM